MDILKRFVRFGFAFLPSPELKQKERKKERYNKQIEQKPTSNRQSNRHVYQYLFHFAQRPTYVISLQSIIIMCSRFFIELPENIAGELILLLYYMYLMK